MRPALRQLARGQGDAIDLSLFTGYSPVAVTMTPAPDKTRRIVLRRIRVLLYQAKVQQLVTTLPARLDRRVDRSSVVLYNYITMDLGDHEYWISGGGPV